ncbi:winged helix-turn-helix transcriptional regulator [Cryptosporangium phraense]|uniref:Winged helix-turn-helix transcriptional regulator n=2 Tax=Cryptosporangium phraense TaxID=2593070 RepID=A0A545ALG6_9ACTN|nr:winged helix-turn-helix transcriptional regulator [Cryptosporangium phraense]
MSLSEYSALMQLSEAPNRRLRMTELAARCALSLSGMSRIVSRLEGTGAVERVRACDDGRGWTAVLTDAGLARLETAWPTHLASVRRHLLAHVTPEDLPAFAAAAERFAGGDAAARAATDPCATPGDACAGPTAETGPCDGPPAVQVCLEAESDC